MLHHHLFPGFVAAAGIAVTIEAAKAITAPDDQEWRTYLYPDHQAHSAKAAKNRSQHRAGLSAFGRAKRAKSRL